MADDRDDEDFLFYGTPIEREEDTSARKRRAIAEAGQLRALPAWKQEVRDEEGRRRFHGAFTGGFSAGYYNTVGSKEGWTPQTFTSSRKSRAEVKQQSIYNFLDEDDIKDLGGRALETSVQYDTFGFTAAEFARKKAEKEQDKRPSAIPGPAPDDIVLPAASSIGIKLLMKMGWRQGRSIKDARPESLYEARREARKALMALSGDNDRDAIGQIESDVPENNDQDSGATPLYILQPKQDLHGLGFDPFKHAPEFRDVKNSRKPSRRDPGADKLDASIRGSLLISNSGKYAPGFGIGALEELGAEDEDIYASGFDYAQTEVEVEPLRLVDSSKDKLDGRTRGVSLCFKLSSDSDYKVERFQAPVIPAGFEPHHKFATAQTADKFPPPPDVPPPEDNNLRVLIEGSASLIARSGKFIEELYKEKSKTNPLFLFLVGGKGSDYYARRLWEQKQKFGDKNSSSDVKPNVSDEKMTAENRGRILGEKPLNRSSKAADSSVQEAIKLQYHLGDTFTQPFSLADSAEAEKPFQDDPAKQERFEQFLKEKYRGGLRSVQSSSSINLSEADRARERLDFEAAAEAIEKGKLKTGKTAPSVHDLLGLNEQRFVSSTQKEAKGLPADDEKSNFPRREEFEWRPTSLLCKRFDLVDPFAGKPMPAQRPRSKMETLVFMKETVKSSPNEKHEGQDQGESVGSQEGSRKAKAQGLDQQDILEREAEPSSASVQRPVDLYKAIFSDDSDDDRDVPTSYPAVDTVKTGDGANMTLNRLVAGDFLQSLGKELGFEMPLDAYAPPLTANNTHSSRGASLKDDSVIPDSSRTNVPSTTGDHDGPSFNGMEPVIEITEAQLKRSESHASYEGSKGQKSDSNSPSTPQRRKSSSRWNRIRGRSLTPENDSSSGKDYRRSRRKHRDSTPGSDSDNDCRDRKSKPSVKKSSDRERSKHRSRHHIHERDESGVRYSDARKARRHRDRSD